MLQWENDGIGPVEAAKLLSKQLRLEAKPYQISVRLVKIRGNKKEVNLEEMNINKNGDFVFEHDDNHNSDPDKKEKITNDDTAITNDNEENDNESDDGGIWEKEYKEEEDEPEQELKRRSVAI